MQTEQNNTWTTLFKNTSIWLNAEVFEQKPCGLHFAEEVCCVISFPVTQVHKTRGKHWVNIFIEFQPGLWTTIFEVLNPENNICISKYFIPGLLYLVFLWIVFLLLIFVVVFFFLQDLLDVLEVSFVQLHFLSLVPLGHRYPLLIQRKLCSAFSCLVFFHALFPFEQHCWLGNSELKLHFASSSLPNCYN